MGISYFSYLEKLKDGDPAERAVQLLRAAADFSVSLEENEALNLADKNCEEGL